MRLMVRAKHPGMVGWWGRGTWLIASSYHTSFPLQTNRYHPWESREEGALSHKFKNLATLGLKGPSNHWLFHFKTEEFDVTVDKVGCSGFSQSLQKS